MNRYQSAAMILFFALLTLVFPVTAQENPPTETSARAPAPAPTTTIVQDGVTVDLFFSTVQQGRVALLRVSGEGVTGARARFREKVSEFFYDETDAAYYGLIAVNIDQTPRMYEFSVFAWKDNGARITIPAQLQVVLGGFVRQDFALGADLAYLVDPELERLEFARLDSIFANYTSEHLWGDDGFQYPVNSELTSAFGAYRIINQTVETRHTGWDLRAPVGTPVSAMGAGRVAYAGLMDIRGNYVVINHGYGVYSAYAHLSQVHVTRGQTVTKGQIIGVSGNTGRSGGPHLHWEVTVNGEWIDSADFLRLWLP